MTEAELLARVLNLATMRGLLAHHCGESRRCDGAPGFPDLVIAGGQGGIIFAELKSDDGSTTPEQDYWLWTLAENASRIGGIRVQLWRPADLESGRIERQLRALAELYKSENYKPAGQAGPARREEDRAGPASVDCAQG